MHFTTIDGVTIKLPEMSEAEVQETAPADFVRKLRVANMDISLGWSATDVTSVYKHMIEKMVLSEGLLQQQRVETKTLLKRVRRTS